MFGYVKTDFPNLFVKDTILYKASYCGLCKSIAIECGLRGRLLLNYDLTFLSVFAHNLAGKDIEIKRQHCVIHPLTKRPVAIPDDLSKRIASLTVILAYYKLSDDVIDNGSGRVKRGIFKKAYKKAKRKEPKFDVIVKESYKELLKYEKQNVDSIDMAADPFGTMMTNIVKELLGNLYTDEIETFAYNLGKWIYLIDAVDDFDKDKKKGNFNVFANTYGNISDKSTLLKEKKSDLEVIFGSILSSIYENAKSLSYKFNHDLTDNIIFKGLFEQTKQILEGRKCKNITKF